MQKKFILKEVGGKGIIGKNENGTYELRNNHDAIRATDHWVCYFETREDAKDCINSLNIWGLTIVEIFVK